MKITRGTFDDIAKRYESAKGSIQRIRAETERTVNTFVRSAELNGTAFAAGVINGRYGSPEAMGVPIDLGTGLALHVMGFLGFASDHLHAIGDGFTSSYFSSLGLGVGKRMADEATRGLKDQGALAPLPSAP